MYYKMNSIWFDCLGIVVQWSQPGSGRAQSRRVAAAHADVTRISRVEFALPRSERQVASSRTRSATGRVCLLGHLSASTSRKNRSPSISFSFYFGQICCVNFFLLRTASKSDYNLCWYKGLLQNRIYKCEKTGGRRGTASRKNKLRLVWPFFHLSHIFFFSLKI